MKLWDITLILALACAAVFAGSARALEVVQGQMDGAIRLSVFGEMSQPLMPEHEETAYQDLRNLAQELKRASSHDRPLVILFSSWGGDAEMAAPLARLFVNYAREYSLRRSQPLIFAITGDCSSACTFFTAALTKMHDPRTMRILVPDETRFFFHGPIDLATGRAFRNKREFNFHLNNGLKRYRDFGVSERWLRRNKSLFLKTQAHLVYAHRLCAQASGIIPTNSCVPTMETIDLIIRGQTSTMNTPDNK